MTSSEFGDDGDEGLYSLLQVSPEAGQDVIRAAFYALARRYHPDVNPSPDAARRMQRLNGAYAVLRDPNRRARYDAERARSRPRLDARRARRMRPTSPNVAGRAREAETMPGSFVVRLVFIVLLVILFLAAGLLLWSDQEDSTRGFPRPSHLRSEAAVRLVAASHVTLWPASSPGSMISQCGLNCT